MVSKFRSFRLACLFLGFVLGPASAEARGTWPDPWLVASDTVDHLLGASDAEREQMLVRVARFPGEAYLVAHRLCLRYHQKALDPNGMDPATHCEDLALAREIAQAASSNSLTRDLGEAVSLWAAYDSDEALRETDWSDVVDDCAARVRRGASFRAKKRMESEETRLGEPPRASLARVYFLYLKGQVYLGCNEMGNAARSFEESALAAGAIGWSVLQAEALRDASIAHLRNLDRPAGYRVLHSMLRHLGGGGDHLGGGGDQRIAFEALSFFVVDLMRLGEYAQALVFVELMEREATHGTDSRILNDARINGVLCQVRLGRFAQAKETIDRLLKEQCFNDKGRSILERNLARIHGRQGRYDQALAIFEGVKNRVDQLGLAQEQAQVRNDICVALILMGQYDRALGPAQDSYRRMKALRNRNGIHTVQVNLGLIYCRQNELEKANEFLTMAQCGFKELGHQGQLMTVEVVLGLLSVYMEGEEERGLSMLNRALTTARELGNAQLEVRALNHLASAHLFLENHVETLIYDQLALIKWQLLQVQPNAYQKERELYGESLLVTGLEGLNLALKKSKAVGDEYAAWWAEANKATLLSIQNQGDEAYALCRRLEDELRGKGHHALESLVSSCLGGILSGIGDQKGAARAHERALELLPDGCDPRARALAQAASARSLWKANKTEQSLAQMQKALTTFEEVGDVLNRGLVQSQLSVLYETMGSPTDVLEHAACSVRSLAHATPGIDDQKKAIHLRNSALAPSERGLDAVLSLLEEGDQKKSRRNDLASQALWFADAARGVLLAGHIDVRREVLERTPTELVEQIQTLLPEDHALIVYQTTRTRSMACVVRHDDLHFVELSSPDSLSVGPQDYLALISTLPGGETKAARDLFDALFAPLLPFVSGCKHLTVFPDRSMVSFPLGVLVQEDGRRLLESYSIGYMLSPSVWLALQTRHEREPNERDYRLLRHLVLGNPMNGSQKKTPLGIRGGSNSLPGSEREILEIEEILGPSCEVLLNREASRTNVLDRLSQEFGIVHFSCHNKFRGGAGSTPALVLSSGGFLDVGTLEENPIRAHLIVLAACESGLGPFARGEGNLGFVYRLLWGGCPRVVVSSWRISDATTSKLMISFYRHLIGEGASPVRALREARLEVLRAGGKTAHPYFWGAFLYWGLPDFPEGD